MSLQAHLTHSPLLSQHGCCAIRPYPLTQNEPFFCPFPFGYPLKETEKQTFT
ncbi:hypothetical protein HMPREF9420_1609 [Segatella salivae DSM 15606]|uniref:Uncharacterized protein n=1 Tax=Segatella salivae DSM 15606 TaxID=888832 RepID=E6MQ41_9BACT|nr:hypothetical protein HMPREF9420_1609 [Segatella salivae DSM 15606]